MPTITREWSIIYSSTTPITIGGSSNSYLLTNKIGIVTGSTSGHSRVGRLVFDFIVSGTTESAFVSACQAAELAFSEPRARVRVIHGSQTHIDWNPAAGAGTNTGFDARPNIEKPGSSVDTGRSRLYRVSIDVTLPSSLNSRAGRRESTYAIDYEPTNRKSFVMTGEYTALAANDATAQYTADIANYETAVFATSMLTGSTYQLLRQRVIPNDSDKVVQFTRAYREITLEQAVGTTDHASVVTQDLRFSEETQGIASTRIKGATVKNLKSFRASYFAEIDVTQTPASGLRALWEGTLRAHVVAQAVSQLGNGPTGSLVDQETFDPDPEGNTIRASFRYRLLDGSTLISARMTKQCIDLSGLQATPVSAGRPHEYDLDEGPPRRLLIVSMQQRIVNGGSFFDYKPPKNYRELERDPQWIKITEGIQPNQIAFVEKTERRQYLFAKRYKGGSKVGGGGGGTTTVERNPAGSSGSVARGTGGNNPDVCVIKNFDGDGE